jgi:hypothetical protein
MFKKSTARPARAINRKPKLRFVSLSRAAAALSADLPAQLAVKPGELAGALSAMGPRDAAYTADEVLRRLDS